MFVSVNKKILYSLIVFLFILIGIFLTLFMSYYSQQLQDNRYSVYLRNKYVVQLLNDNLNLQSKLAEIGEAYPQLMQQSSWANFLQNVTDTRQQLSREKQLNDELRRNYKDNREALATGIKIVLLCLFVVVLCISLIILLLNRWVIHPIERLTAISQAVSEGNYSDRVNLRPHSLWRDEFDILSEAFNNMLETTENNIKDIQHREQFLQQLIDTIPDGIRVIDKDYNVIMANKAFYHLLNIKKSCIGQKCHAAYGNPEAPCSPSKYNCPLLSLKHKGDFLHTIHEVGATPLYVNATSLRYGRTHTNDYIVEALHDLSNDVQFSHQQKVSSLAFLSTSVAHELKNSLGAVRIILEGLLENEYRDMPASDAPKKYLTMAHQQLIEAVRTPEQLLRLAQYAENDISDINLADAINDMTIMIDYDAKRRGIEVITQIDNKLIFTGNEADFKMIILNLLQNAIKAMPQGGTLTISGQKHHHMAEINIIDTGIGISEEKIKHIFEPFYSGDAKNKSSGLGLAIVRSLTTKAKGEISVKSKPGQGSVFTLKLPLKKNVRRSDR